MIVDLSKKIESKKDLKEADLELLRLFRDFIDEAIELVVENSHPEKLASSPSGLCLNSKAIREILPVYQEDLAN